MRERIKGEALNTAFSLAKDCIRYYGIRHDHCLFYAPLRLSRQTR